MRVLDEAVAQAQAMLADDANKVSRHAVDEVANLIAGFDDAFGLEFLASVHWVATRMAPPARNASEALALIHDWSERKRTRYDDAQVRAAWRRLEEARLVKTSAEDPRRPAGRRPAGFDAQRQTRAGQGCPVARS